MKFDFDSRSFWETIVLEQQKFPYRIVLIFS